MANALHNVLMVSLAAGAIVILWFFMVAIAIKEQSAAVDLVKGPKSNLKGATQANIGLAFMGLACVLMVVNGLATSTYLTGIFGASLAIFGGLRALNDVGQYAFPIDDKWKRMRFKTFFQTLGLVGGIYAINHVFDWIFQT